MFDSSLRHQIKGPDSQESGLFYWRWAGEEMQSNRFAPRGLSRADADFDDRHQSLERASNSNTSQLTLSAFSTTPCSSQLTPHLPRHTAQKFACEFLRDMETSELAHCAKIQRKSSHQQMILPTPLQGGIKAVQPKQPMDRRSGRDRRQTVGQPPQNHERRVTVEPRQPEVIEIEVTPEELDAMGFATRQGTSPSS